MKLAVWYLQSSTLLRMIYVVGYFARVLATDHGANIVQNICLTEQSFLSKITTGYLWKFPFLEICMHLISNFTCKNAIFNPFHATGLFLYPLKKSENLRVSGVFRGYRERPVAWNRFKGSWIVTMKSLSVELTEVIVPKYSKKCVLKIF